MNNEIFAWKNPDFLQLLKIADMFSYFISVESGVDRCIIWRYTEGVLNSENLQLTENLSLRSVSESEIYKYFGISYIVFEYSWYKAGDERSFIFLSEKNINKPPLEWKQGSSIQSWVMSASEYSLNWPRHLGRKSPLFTEKASNASPTLIGDEAVRVHPAKV